MLLAAGSLSVPTFWCLQIRAWTWADRRESSCRYSGSAISLTTEPHDPEPEPETKFSFHVTSEGKSVCIISIYLYLYICCGHSCLQEVWSLTPRQAPVAGKTPPLTGRNQEPGPELPGDGRMGKGGGKGEISGCLSCRCWMLLASAHRHHVQNLEQGRLVPGLPFISKTTVSSWRVPGE